MNIDDFLNAPSPDAAWSPALKALWHAEKGEWDTAHALSQEGDTAEGAWVHANLHREEGDLGNARYWYSRAGKPESDAPIETERREIIQALLS